MTDKLEQIEEHALSVVPFQRTLSRAPGVMAADVLALVNIAKAAELLAVVRHEIDPRWETVASKRTAKSARASTGPLWRK